MVISIDVGQMIIYFLKTIDELYIVKKKNLTSQVVYAVINMCLGLLKFGRYA